jgi:hypothetical protein
MGTDRDKDDPPIDIYGPEGLRMWLRVAIRYSVSRIVPPYRVHELMDGKNSSVFIAVCTSNLQHYFTCLVGQYQWRQNGNRVIGAMGDSFSNGRKKEEVIGGAQKDLQGKIPSHG